jgi:hypothetical protein
MFFVVTTGRSGSQSIAHELTRSPTCICLHEPEPVFIKEATMYQYGLLSDEWMQALVLSTRVPILKGKIYGESNQKLASLIPVLARAFPDSKFIWLIRDGRQVVASAHFARKWYTPVGELVSQRKHLARSLKLKEWIWYRLRGDLLGDMNTGEWESMSRFEQNCWLWSRTNEIIQGHLASLPRERWMLVKIETLYEQLPDMCNFVAIESPAQVERARYNATRASSGSRTAPKHWTEWSEQEKSLFEKWCCGMMTRLYPEWRDENGQWQEVSGSLPLPPKLPSWQQRFQRLQLSLTSRLDRNL